MYDASRRSKNKVLDSFKIEFRPVWHVYIAVRLI